MRDFRLSIYGGWKSCLDGARPGCGFGEKLPSFVFFGEELEGCVEDGGDGGWRIEDYVVLLRRVVREDEGGFGLHIEAQLRTSKRRLMPSRCGIEGEKKLTSS